MKSILECDTCTVEATGLQVAIAHVIEYPEHVMTATDDEDGTTTRVAMDFADDEDTDDDA